MLYFASTTQLIHTTQQCSYMGAWASQLKSHNSLRTNTLPKPLILVGKIVIYDNTVQSQITFCHCGTLE